MSLEEKIENLTNVIADLKEVLFEALTSGPKAALQTHANYPAVEEKPKQTRTRASKVVELKPEPKAEVQESDEWGAETVISEHSVKAEEEAAEAAKAEAGGEIDDWEAEFADFGSTKKELVEIMEVDELRTQLNNLINALAPSYAKREGIDEKAMKTKLITKVRVHCNGKSITEIAPEDRKPLIDWAIKTELKG